MDYDRVVMLDADNLFLQNTDELFQCGQFCAVFINPCIFHTGLFVLQVLNLRLLHLFWFLNALALGYIDNLYYVPLQPSMEVFNDMLHDLEVEKSNSDGADQGFIGNYFAD